MKILFLTNVPSPYRVDFFNELGMLCELTVLFEKTTSDERHDSWRNYKFEHFNGIFLKGKSVDVDSAICPEVIKYLKPGVFDQIVVTDFLSPTGMIAILWMRMKKIGYWLESDGGIAKSGKGIKEWLKKYLISKARGYFSTCIRHDNYYLMYGAVKDRIYRYPFTSVDRNEIINELLNFEDKKEIRKNLKMTGDKIVLSIGQFIYRKGFDILIKAAAEMPDVNFYIVGGSPTKEYLDLIELYNVRNVCFVGFKTKNALKLYYDAVDLFVLPTREDIWGLVVNEAMAHGLPVITTDNCNAGLEMVVEGVNGYIVPTDNYKALVEVMHKYFSKDSVAMKIAALEKSKIYTIENMARKHLEIFESWEKKWHIG